jgi:hypothetical protein
MKAACHLLRLADAIIVRLQAKTSTAPVGPNGVPLNQTPATPQTFQQPNFGPKYEQHIQQLQSSLEEAQKRIEDLQKQEASLR